MRILAIDIGGTKSALATCKLTESCDPTLEHVESFNSKSFKSLTAMIEAWQLIHPSVAFDVIGAGVAGPLFGDSVHLTNLGWNISTKDISHRTGKPFKLCNDMVAHGWSILSLPTDQLEIINSGRPRKGPKVLIAAGTGLGESIISYDGVKYTPLPGEGGHASFSPCNSLERRLLEFISEKSSGHVSWERVLGGAEGFRNLGEFLAADVANPLPSSLPVNEGDWGSAVESLAGKGDPLAKKIMETYAELYGREAGNLALKCLATGGVYIGGGIAPRILPWIKNHFMRGFTDKGRFKEVLSEIPVYVVLDRWTGLKGAALQFFH